MSEDKQAVTKKDDASSTQQAEDTGAQEKTIDELLSEFEDDEPKKTEKPKAGVRGLSPEQRGQIIKEIKTEMKVSEELERAVEEIKGDAEVESEYVRWKLEERAKNDERVWKAFINRKQKPSAWKAITTEISKEIAAKYGKKEQVDKDKLSSAVRSANYSAGNSDSSFDVKKMSSSDFEKNKEAILAAAMNG